MIKAIFFSKFDIREGPKIIHQVPTDSIVPSATSSQPSLFHFPSYSSYIIPRQDFCSRPISFCTPKHRILGHPVCLTSSVYDRNEYIFNFGLVLPIASDPTSYQIVVDKLASLFRSLESESHFLSADRSAPNTGKVYALCEILLEDLNNYCECMVPIDDSNSLNIKLFPIYPPPPPISPHHVPLSTVRLEALTDDNWDLTVVLILPHINGLNSIKQIALLADADYKLVRKAIEHLLYYGCIILLDIFGFGASYAPTAEMARFVSDAEAQEECRRYVQGQDSRLPGSVPGAEKGIGRAQMVELYCSLRQGHSLRNWCMEHGEVMGMIDIRRFITFGVIKGFLYRVHKFVVVMPSAAAGGTGGRDDGAKKGNWGFDPALQKYLDGTHCFDEICTELMLSEKELMARLKGFGDLQIIQR